MLRWFAGRQIRNVAVSITINRFLLQYWLSDCTNEDCRG
jgi:hypothetical protein